MLRFLLPATALAALALAGCDVGDDGPRTTQTRDVAPFTRIDSSGSVDARVRIGNPRTVRVLAGEKVIDDVRTEVRDGTLQLTFDHHGFGGGDVDVEADGLDAGALTVRSTGSGDVELAGAAEKLTLDIDGSGDADLRELDARTADVVVGGSGDAEVTAGERLAVAIDGSGDVRYAGDPVVTKDLDGSGELKRAG